MILDMYLIGQKTRNRMRSLHSIGHWRNHPDLHNFIIQFFADGVDTCQEIELSIDNLRQTLRAVEMNDLPPANTLFGKSTPEHTSLTLVTLDKAIQWLLDEQEGETRRVIYQATW